jgi:hypothetical protein
MATQQAQAFARHYEQRRGAATCSQTLLHLLDQQGCDNFEAFGSCNFEFPSSEDVPAPSKIVDQITKIILRNFWAKSG